MNSKKAKGVGKWVPISNKRKKSADAPKAGIDIKPENLGEKLDKKPLPFKSVQ